MVPAFRATPLNREYCMNPSLRTLSFGVLCAVISCAPAPARVDTAAAEQAIRQQVDSWNGYLAASNDSAIAAIYTDDAVLLPPAMPRVSGRVGIRQFFAQIWALKATLKLTPVSVRVASSGDWAVEEGNWSWRAPTPSGEQTDAGKYLVTWTRTADGWHAVQDIWNSDQAPPAVPAAAK